MCDPQELATLLETLHDRDTQLSALRSDIADLEAECDASAMALAAAESESLRVARDADERVAQIEAQEAELRHQHAALLTVRPAQPQASSWLCSGLPTLAPPFPVHPLLAAQEHSALVTELDAAREALEGMRATTTAATTRRAELEAALDALENEAAMLNARLGAMEVALIESQGREQSTAAAAAEKVCSQVCEGGCVRVASIDDFDTSECRSMR